MQIRVLSDEFVFENSGWPIPVAIVHRAAIGEPASAEIALHDEPALGVVIACEDLGRMGRDVGVDQLRGRIAQDRQKALASCA